MGRFVTLLYGRCESASLSHAERDTSTDCEASAWVLPPSTLSSTTRISSIASGAGRLALQLLLRPLLAALLSVLDVDATECCEGSTGVDGRRVELADVGGDPMSGWDERRPDLHVCLADSPFSSVPGSCLSAASFFTIMIWLTRALSGESAAALGALTSLRSGISCWTCKSNGARYGDLMVMVW